MKPLRIVLLIVFIILAIYLIQMFSVGYGKVDISKYKGDGTIKTVGSGAIAKGFKVDFPLFELSKKHEGKYIIESMPIIDKDYMIMIEVLSSGDKYNINKSSLSLSVKNKEGKTFTLDDKMMNAYKTQYDNENDFYYFYGEKSSTLLPEDIVQDLPIEISFSYIPGQGSVVNQTQGKLTLKVGGSK